MKFDVLCIEVEKTYRPLNYAINIQTFLSERGYRKATDQIGRNQCMYS